MLSSLSVVSQWIDQPAAADALERLTWADLRIYAANRAITRAWDRNSRAELESIFIPLFPLARWVVENWWALLYEPCRAEQVPPSGMAYEPGQRAWLRRHCLRSAGSDLLLPRACFYSDGRGVCVHWSSDEPGSYPQMPAEFIGNDLIHLTHDAAAEGLGRFVGDVIRRLENEPDSSVVRLREDWSAITDADPEESAFCRAAGRLGLDPYRSDEWEPSLVALLVGGLGADIDRPLVVDLLEAASLAATDDATPVARSWEWVEQVRESYGLRESPMSRMPLPDTARPAASGYRLAGQIRSSMGGPGIGPLKRVADAAEVLGVGALTFQPHNHLPLGQLKAVVGWGDGEESVIVGPPPTREETRRFLEARGLYHAAFACESSPRLITGARTWDQQVSRAFAAELLAPRAELLAKSGGRASGEDPDLVLQRLAIEYKVSVQVISHQLQNAGVRLDDAA